MSVLRLPVSRRHRTSRLAAFVLTPLVLLLAACGENTGPGCCASVDSLAALPRALSTAEQDAVAAGNTFALSLLRESDTRANGKNVLLSPLSVSLSLGMTMNGAAGTTLSEMTRTLGWGARPRAEINTAYRDLMTLLPSLDTTVTIRIANGIWVRQPLVVDTAFGGDVRRYFGADVRRAANPQAMFDAVNSWGNQQTDGMIPRVLTEPPPDDLLMLLANAVYFSGRWRDRFNVADTRPAPFRLESGTEVSVPMMQRTGSFRGAQTSTYVAAELPYGNSAYAMLLVVPQEGNIAELVAGLTPARLTEIVAGLQTQGERAQLFLPRFSVKGSVELKPHLAQLGMPRAFSDAAEFPRLLGERVKVGFVQHSVALDVDERGTRAAAVTVVGIVPVSLPPQFRADRPFVFFIRERFAGTILFTGVVRDPRQ